MGKFITLGLARLVHKMLSKLFLDDIINIFHVVKHLQYEVVVGIWVYLDNRSCLYTQNRRPP
jgi:hypothetical protein